MTAKAGAWNGQIIMDKQNIASFFTWSILK